MKKLFYLLMLALKVGEKKVIVYFENNGVRTQDTLYVNVTEGLPEIKYL